MNNAFGENGFRGNMRCRKVERFLAGFCGGFCFGGKVTSIGAWISRGVIFFIEGSIDKSEVLDSEKGAL